MSGQWEVVGKKKEKGSKLPVPKLNNNKDIKSKKNTLNGVKIEEVLPKSQVQNLYGNIKSNKENKKPVEKSKTLDGGSKKLQKKDKLPEPPKPKPPKSIESALNSIDVEEFKSIFEKSKNHFPEAPIVWLKELVQFLNQKVPLDIPDPLFQTKPEGYPFSAIPSDIEVIIEKSIKEAGKSNAQLFFDICLTSMATEMSKGLPALGYKFFLQYIAMNEPKLVAENINKHVTLRSSYQNRPNIGLSILWAVGHVGIKDLNSGLTVFQELFLPVVDMKNYSRYVATFLLNLISRDYDAALTKEEFLLILDTIYSDKKHFPTDIKQGLSSKVSNLKPLLFKSNKEKYHSWIESLLKKISSNNNKPYQNCLCDILCEIFQKDQTLFANWNKVYIKNVSASAVLLHYLGDNWSNLSKKLNKGAVLDLLNSFKVTNDELSLKKRKEDGLKESVDAIRKINEKMVAKKKSSFPFKTLSFLMVLTIASLVYFDIKQHGSWNVSSGETHVPIDGETDANQGGLQYISHENYFPNSMEIDQILNNATDAIKLSVTAHGDPAIVNETNNNKESRTRKALKDSGACEYSRKAVDIAKEGLYWIDARVEENFPGYHKIVIDFSEPYIHLFSDLRKITCNALHHVKEVVVEKYPLVVESIKSYAPGLIEESQKAFTNIYSTSILYFNRSVDYLKKEVFIGQLSPENVQRVVIEAFNTTQQKATEYYHWIYEKVQTSIK